MNEQNNRFELQMQVRDYECDLQGIVNNANYQHYYEHTRHQFLKQYNVSFAQLHDAGIDVVVARMEMSFRLPLHPGDEFVSELALERDGIKYVFNQRIYKLPEHQLCNVARFDCVVLEHGTLSRNEYLDNLFFKNDK